MTRRRGRSVASESAKVPSLDQSILVRQAHRRASSAARFRGAVAGDARGTLRDSRGVERGPERSRVRRRGALGRAPGESVHQPEVDARAGPVLGSGVGRASGSVSGASERDRGAERGNRVGGEGRRPGAPIRGGAAPGGRKIPRDPIEVERRAKACESPRRRIQRRTRAGVHVSSARRRALPVEQAMRNDEATSRPKALAHTGMQVLRTQCDPSLTSGQRRLARSAAQNRRSLLVAKPLSA